MTLSIQQSLQSLKDSPFDIKAGSIFFDAKINDNNVESFIFDTGATVLQVDLEIARKLGLPVSNEPSHILPIEDANGNVLENRPHMIDSFSLGPIKKENFVAYSYDLSGISQLKGIQQNGIIGLDVYDGHSFSFDFSSKKCLIK